MDSTGLEPQLPGVRRYRVGRYASVNLLYTPDPHFLVGLEFLWGEREDKNGATGHDSRLQVTAKYSFDSSDFQQ